MLVTTVSNKEVERNLCIKINNEFYQKNIDCVLIENRWYRKNNIKVYFDYESQSYQLRDGSETRGIIAYYPDDMSFGFGEFKTNELSKSSFLQISSSSGFYVVNDGVFSAIPKILMRDGRYIFSLYAMKEGIFEHHGKLPGQPQYFYSFNRSYNCDNLLPLFININRDGIIPDLIDKSIKIPSVFKKYSFGLEFESASGGISEYDCKKFGLIPLKDGSIPGHEYVTIPMIGIDGVNLLKNQTNVLNNICTLNRDCSLHVHFGGFPLDPEKLLGLYNLMFMIQGELNHILPRDIFESGNYKSSGKNYCQRLPMMLNSVDKLYSMLSSGIGQWDGDMMKSHPEDPDRQRKWDNHSRYYNLNLINMFFGERIKTVEFRMHSPTYNFSKVINWICICMAILKYAEDMESPIIENKISLKEILENAFNKNQCNILEEYIAIRKAEFTQDSLIGDRGGYFDIVRDQSAGINSNFYKNIFE